MATMKEAFYAILKADAQLTGAGKLGNLLGKSTVEPYGVFFGWPPTDAPTPCISYASVSQSGRLPRRQIMSVTAFGNNFEAILDIVHDLLDDAVLEATDVQPLLCVWDGRGPDLWDDDLKCYYAQDRYLLKGAKA